jgi:N-acetylmuramoyl-L-alanine amidase
MLPVYVAPHSAWGEVGDGSRPACDRAAFRLLVDVGHTAEVSGARSARAVSEYEFNLRLAKQIEQALSDAGFVRTTLMITAEPPRRGLFQRAERANSLPADLFLSIHHDSVPNEFLETWEFEGEEFRFSDRFKGHSIFVSHENADRRGSLRFGRLLGHALKARGLQYTPHYTEAIMGNRRRELVDAAAGVYRYDQLVVLKYTRMPAVLLEAGSIINRNEELELRFPERRALISESVVDAVASFCALRARAVWAHSRGRAVGRPATVRGSNR